MAKKLKCWRGLGCVPKLNEKQARIYIAAYSVADIVILYEEAGLSMPPNYHELKNYWYDEWGLPMAGVEITRGIWVAKNHYNDKPEKYYPIET